MTPISKLVAVGALVTWAGCGASAPAGATVHPIPERCDGRCDPSETCRAGFAWRCECVLDDPPSCGPIEPERGPDDHVWSCTPLDPATDRGDGCPYARPDEGSACTGAASCRYSDDECGWTGILASCEAGTWRHAPAPTRPNHAP